MRGFLERKHHGKSHYYFLFHKREPAHGQAWTPATKPLAYEGGFLPLFILDRLFLAVNWNVFNPLGSCGGYVLYGPAPFLQQYSRKLCSTSAPTFVNLA